MDFNFDDVKKMIDNNMQEEKTKTIELNKK